MALVLAEGSVLYGLLAGLLHWLLVRDLGSSPHGPLHRLLECPHSRVTCSPQSDSPHDNPEVAVTQLPSAVAHHHFLHFLLGTNESLSLALIQDEEN